MSVGGVITVGLSGGSCSGKTTVANMIRSIFNRCVVLNQDSYYHSEESPLHMRDTTNNVINWEVFQAFDMNQMENDLKSNHNLQMSHNLSSLLTDEKDTLEKEGHPMLVLLEGISILNDPRLYESCDLKYFLTIDKTTMWDRRQGRVWGDECWQEEPGYFHEVAWPGYLAIVEELKGKRDSDILFFDSVSLGLDELCSKVLKDIVSFKEKQKKSKQ